MAQKSLSLTKVFCCGVAIVFLSQIFDFRLVHLQLLREKKMFGASERVLKNHKIETKPALSRVVCGRDCMMKKNCKSFNFYENAKICDLNGATWDDHPGDFLRDTGSVYFDANDRTPLLASRRESCKGPPRAGSCKELLNAGCNTSAVYSICPRGSNDCKEVYCDMETDGGGWIVFQRRQDGSVSFDRYWNEYRNGFGNLSGEFWLGNEMLASLTSNDSQGAWELRIDLWDWDNKTARSIYKDFRISDELEKYTIYADRYDHRSTTMDNSLRFHNMRAFTTRDQDNDEFGAQCAQIYQGGWWFAGCGICNLNGPYMQYPDQPSEIYKGVHWYFWPYRIAYSLKKCTMKIRESYEVGSQRP
ncbi:ficolin-3-like [Acanthaster planci]|uniref:Ficolin-3-like n=1 Tax=Acanthaster planci TaxID=133434 RepID=A0A8B7ZKL9_ACAPL|nr:ficolin-3-like [Acanthaster planci]